eukprot:TRINITY_DN13279_c0_g1::TRINITY_DN13279_c0_g1_i1::g.12691::m.12691 TRINITY_DN13279_c0_g1::TRINITY_DN13279_c0_g1_i1::g.12691  ORF type:complete len:258 (+),score=20.99,Phi-29_GP16_7/PF06720.6/0.03 TRINITY_DN13279_c0_g1_i1:24-797(+)
MANYFGLWQRTSLEEPIGSVVDTTTNVFWLQTRSPLFGDVRIPALARPTSVNSMDIPRELLAKQKGFAGNAVIENDVCTWHRDIDYQPPTGDPDCGSLLILPNGDLQEDGVFENYREIWKHLDDGQHTLAMKLHDDQHSGYFVMSGAYFIYLMNNRHSQKLPQSRSLETYLTDNSLSDVEKDRILSDFVVCFGTRSSDGNFLVQHSTIPSLENTIICSDADFTICDKTVLQQVHEANGVRTWQLVQNNLELPWKKEK